MASIDWEARYLRDLEAQRNSGPVTLTDEHRRKNKELFAKLRDIIPFEDAYKVSDCDLMYRFLIGKHWNVMVAESGIREYLQLRNSERLDSIIAEQMHPTIVSVLAPYDKDVPCPLYGLDKEGLPILWLSPDASKLAVAMKEFSHEQLLRGQLKSMELGRYACLQRKVDRCTYVIDLGGITVSGVNKSTLALLRGVMKLLQIAYPEIMRRLLIFNTGWAVSAAWKVLRPLVDARVQDKIKFESGPPTLAALQQYMSADNVHPAFHGTGFSNVLDPIITVEVHRIRHQLAGRGSLHFSTTDARGSFSDMRNNTSFLDADAQTLYSMRSASLNGTACPTPNDSAHYGPGGRAENIDHVVIGLASVMASWMETMDPQKHILDLSLSMGSSSSDETALKVERGDAGEGDYPIPRNVGAPPSHDMTSLLSPRVLLAGGRPMPSDAPRRSAAPGAADARQTPTELPSISITLTFRADGTIIGYCGQQWVGRYRNGLLFVPALDADAATQTDLPTLLLSPPSAKPQKKALSATSNDDLSGGVQVGELLMKAGHTLRSFLIVCDAHRRARYLLRVSRLRWRLTIYNIVGDTTVHTEKNNRHYVYGEKAKMGFVVPHAKAANTGDKGAWMLYGEDVTRRSVRSRIAPLQNLFSRSKRAAANNEKGGSNAAEKAQAGGWTTTMLAALRPHSSSPTKKTMAMASSATSSASDGAVLNSEGQSKKNREMEQDKYLPLAECQGQTVTFHNLLTKNTLSDLFALAIAITQSWSGEMDGRRSKAVTPLRSTCDSSTDEIAT